MLRLVPFGISKETIAVLQRLLLMACSGQVRGIAICWWNANGSTEVSLTGIFSAQPRHALAASDLLKAAAGRQLDLFA